MSNIRFEALKNAWSHEPMEVKNPSGRASVIFAQNVFTREKMKEYIASNILEQLFDLMDNEKTLSRDIANSVAIGMKKWAMEQGATHCDEGVGGFPWGDPLHPLVSTSYRWHGGET